MVLKNGFYFLKDAFSGLPPTIWVLSIVSFINRSGSMVVVYLALYLTQHLHYDIISAGNVLSCFGIGSIAGAFAGGYLTDKFGYFKVMMATLILSGISLIAMLLVEDYVLMCIYAFLMSLISEAFRPANQVSIRANSTNENRTRSFSLIRVWINLAVTFALTVGGLLVGLGWHWLFWADGFTCLAAAFLLFYYFKKRGIIPEDKVKVEVAQTMETKQKEIVKPPYLDNKYLFFIFLTFINAIVFMQIVWTIPLFFKVAYGWNEAKIGIVSALNGLVVMLVEMPLVFRLEGRRSTMWFVRLGTFLYAISYFCFVIPAFSGILAAVLYMVIVSFGEVFVMPFSSSWVTKRAGDKYQGQYMALYGTAYSLANVAAPAIGTRIIAYYSYTHLWWLIGILSLFALLGFNFLKE
jgi:MFS family permease